MRKNGKIAKVLVCCGLLMGNYTSSFGQTLIKGNLADQKEAVLHVSYVDNEGFKRDVITVKNGSFEWNKPFEFPASVSLSLGKNGEEGKASFWTTPGTMSLTLKANDLSNYQLSGSALDLEVRTFEKKIEPETQKLKELSEGLKEEKNAEAKTEISKKWEALRAQLIKMKMDFIEQNPSSYYSSYLFYSIKSSINADQTKEILQQLRGEAIKSPFTKKVASEYMGKINGAVGHKAPLFSAVDINGKEFKLSEVIGKNYIIIDFWASWCGPCRVANPHLKELHNKYEKDGLTVVGVADDDFAEAAWRKAVVDDKIEQFTHLRRGIKGMENFFDNSDISMKYGVPALPTKVLIDKNGVIVGKYVGLNEGLEMDAKLKEIFGR